MKKTLRIITTIILIGCGGAIALLSASLPANALDWWQIVTLFIPTALVAVLFFVLAWQVAAGASFREIFKFIMSIVWGH